MSTAASQQRRFEKMTEAAADSAPPWAAKCAPLCCMALLTVPPTATGRACQCCPAGTVVMCTARAVLVLDIADIKLAAPVVGFLAAAASVVWPYIVLTCEKGYAL